MRVDSRIRHFLAKDLCAPVLVKEKTPKVTQTILPNYFVENLITL